MKGRNKVKATELVKQLQKLIDNYGDEYVAIDDYNNVGTYDMVDSVDIKFDINEIGDRKFIIK